MTRCAVLKRDLKWNLKPVSHQYSAIHNRNDENLERFAMAGLD